MIQETELWSEELSDAEAAAVVGGGAGVRVLAAEPAAPVPSGSGPIIIVLLPVPSCLEKEPELVASSFIQG